MRKLILVMQGYGSSNLPDIPPCNQPDVPHKRGTELNSGALQKRGAIPNKMMHSFDPVCVKNDEGIRNHDEKGSPTPR
jgi:hypothetical protein